MRHDLEKRVRRRLARLVTGQESLRTFNRWFVAAVWDIEQEPASLRDLVYGIKARLDEYDYRHLSKKELLCRLSLILQNYRVGREDDPPSSSNFILTSP